jgi:hypothetical protein
MDEATLKEIRAGIKKSQELLETMRLEIQNASKAGLETAEMSKEYNSLKEQVRKLESVYGR